VRIWDVHPSRLCRQHLLGEHRELHGLWNIITQDKRGYSRHPETLRWVGKEKALYLRHEALAAEIERRGYRHNSPLDKKLAVGKGSQTVFVDSIRQQYRLLRAKACDCVLEKRARTSTP
jgi:hypothetical protein